MFLLSHLSKHSLFRAEARTQAPLIPGPRGEGGSPHCQAHSRMPYPFCNRYYYYKFLKVFPYHEPTQRSSFQPSREDYSFVVHPSYWKQLFH